VDAIREFFHLFFSAEGLTELIKWGGLVGLTGIIFAETGLLVGFFLPGDTLLLTAGMLASATGEPPLWQMLVFLSIAAIVGDSTGFAIGRRAGPALYSRPNSRFFKQEHLLRAKAFYDRWGGITIVLARFLPVVRTFAPVVAGIASMNYRRFVLFNVVGGVAWIFSMTLIGYFFGQIPFVREHLEKIILGAILLHVLVLPIVAAGLKRWRVAHSHPQ
jgi:membrane-associated protein